jgi:uncharacterized membrane protein YhhN
VTPRVGWTDVKPAHRGPLLAALVAAGVYVVGLSSLPPGLLMLVKPVPVAILAWLVFTERPDVYGRRLVAGLVLSAVGDALLATDEHFLAGLSAFLAAHLAYAFAFLSDERRLRAERMLPFVVWIVAARVYLQPNLYTMAGPVTVYMVAIGLMMWRAAARVGRKGAPTPAEWSALAGAVLFGLSDTVLAVNRFRAALPLADYVVILLYWAGQYGIARSALDEPSPEWRRPVVNPGTIGGAPGSRRSS